jgi:hypothetical protein
MICTRRVLHGGRFYIIHPLQPFVNTFKEKSIPNSIKIHLLAANRTWNCTRNRSQNGTIRRPGPSGVSETMGYAQTSGQLCFSLSVFFQCAAAATCVAVSETELFYIFLSLSLSLSLSLILSLSPSSCWRRLSLHCSSF